LVIIVAQPSLVSRRILPFSNRPAGKVFRGGVGKKRGEGGGEKEKVGNLAYAEKDFSAHLFLPPERTYGKRKRGGKKGGGKGVSDLLGFYGQWSNFCKPPPLAKDLEMRWQKKGAEIGKRRAKELLSPSQDGKEKKEYRRKKRKRRACGF